MAATCPECESPVDIDEMDVDIGDEFSCSECGALIRVASDSPLEFELADDDEDEDEDDDFEDEEDDEEELEDEDDDLGDETDE